MKKSIVIFLTLLLLLPSFGQLAVFSVFKINQKQISKTICVQRKWVKNTCNGRCVLRKSLKKLENTNKKMNNILKEKAETHYIAPVLIVFTPLKEKQIQEKKFVYITSKTSLVSSSFFKPPIYLI